MYPFYANVPPPAPPSYHQPRFASAVPVAPHAFAVPRDQPSLTFDEMIKKRYTDSDSRLHDAISRSWFPDPGTRQQCLHFVSNLRIHGHLFMHTYVHLVSCCKGGYLHLLVQDANTWKEWGSVQQLARHSLIRNKLAGFWEYPPQYPCHQHKFLFDQHLIIKDDENDLLSHLLYCGRKPELYKLSKNPVVGGHGLTESEQVIELLWQFLVKPKPQETDVARRLRALIYRMARKSAYLPHALQIAHTSMSHKQMLGSGANGSVTKATLDGRAVVIKKILCHDRATQRKCLEMFSSEAILWKTLEHKNIVPFLGVVTEGTFDMGLVSPFFKNGDIKGYMKRYNPKDWPSLARKLGRDLAEALDYIHCHEPPIVHGDLKGNNVLVDDTGHARLGDFGQSHASDSGKYLDSTRVGLAASPVHWMAPEIMVGGDRIKASDKSDIYSFGCVLYEMLSGKIPFQGLPMGDVVRCVERGDRPHRPESISRDDRLWKITNSCWEKNPENRPSATRLVSSFH